MSQQDHRDRGTFLFFPFLKILKKGKIDVKS